MGTLGKKADKETWAIYIGSSFDRIGLSPHSGCMLVHSVCMYEKILTDVPFYLKLLFH